MNRNEWVRQSHRWLSIAFTVAVVLNIISMATGQPPAWVGMLALLPLLWLLLSGLYLFFLPYATKWRGGKRVDGSRAS